MGVKRMESVRVNKDVVVPKRLLSVRKDWNPQDNGQKTIGEQGPVQRVIHRGGHRRPFSVASVNLGRPEPSFDPGIGRRRRTSDPVTIREANSVRSSTFAPLESPILGSTPRFEAFPSYDNAALEYTRTEAETSSSSVYSTSPSDYSSDQSAIPQRSGTVRSIVHAVVPDAVRQTARDVVGRVRRSSIHEVYEKAKTRGDELERKLWVQVLFEYGVYSILLCFVYFVLVGLPLWKGAVYWLYWAVSTKFVITGGFSITIGIAAFYAFAPLFLLFEKEPPIVERPHDFDRNTIPGVSDTALLIPCYKSASIIPATLEAALKIFPPSHIFVIANGNSETPLDDTEEVCRPYGVNHIWSPVGSKIVAQFVGCYAAKGFKNVLLIDDDCALPPNFPVVSERLTGQVQSIGYTIKSVGPDSSRGSWCQQAQDLEYKLSGLQRDLAGKMGSATFPHGAISLWNRNFLIQTFHDHPGFSVSEDWFFGHSCRRLGGRIKMCTSVFVETETPNAVFFSSGGSRGGFGEMTVLKQRFLRWNFFFVNGMWYNLGYIFGSWKLGWWEIGAKIFVFQEVYETLLYLFTPFILPISFLVRPSFCGYLLAGTVVMYLINVVIFNEVHLRLRKERVSWTVLLVYYMPYKLVLTLINVFSCYWSLFKYAAYFAKRHPKVIEDEKAVGVVLRLEETTPVGTRINSFVSSDGEDEFDSGRRMHATAVGTRTSVEIGKAYSTDEVIDAADENRAKRISYLPGVIDYIPPSPERMEFYQHVKEDGFHVQDSAADEIPVEKPGRRRKTSWSQSPV